MNERDFFRMTITISMLMVFVFAVAGVLGLIFGSILISTIYIVAAGISVVLFFVSIEISAIRVKLLRLEESGE